MANRDRCPLCAGLITQSYTLDSHLAEYHEGWQALIFAALDGAGYFRRADRATAAAPPRPGPPPVVDLLPELTLMQQLASWERDGIVNHQGELLDADPQP